ncbi:MAG: cardiolipin synthase, partial [Butyricicoccus pullicaecorum]|nr:cardiolipin synthase [Butyricicoccus pullicaecorum]
EKAKQGVEVRIMYDDAGCMSKLPAGYDRYLRSLGIRTVRFNRFIPTLNTYLNYRDHRKITVVDGNVGYMGGANIADEYINRKSPFGHWKDTGVRLMGPGVANMTEMFLQMWEYTTKDRFLDRARYMPTVVRSGDGYVQPFYDSPLDDRNVGETVFMHIINRAQRYVYITTPYLILDNEMITALTVAAQSGIDVRIITPGIPDKKLVYRVTRSYYQQLHRAGVKIYEYRPGFLHAKMIVSDDDVAVVGTMNMDFRSFFLHFECGTVLYGGETISEIRDDVLDTMGLSRQIDDEWFRSVPWLASIAASILRLFAPML